MRPLNHPELAVPEQDEDDDRFTICLYDFTFEVTPLAFYRAEFNGRVQLGRTDSDGGAHFELGPVPVTIELAWTAHARAPKERPEFYDFYGFVELPAESASPESKALALLRNNGLAAGDDLTAGLRRFQKQFGHLLSPPLRVDGQLTPRTRALMQALFESCPKNA